MGMKGRHQDLLEKAVLLDCLQLSCLFGIVMTVVLIFNSVMKS